MSLGNLQGTNDTISIVDDLEPTQKEIRIYLSLDNFRNFSRSYESGEASEVYWFSYVYCYLASKIMAFKTSNRLLQAIFFFTNTAFSFFHKKSNSQMFSSSLRQSFPSFFYPATYQSFFTLQQLVLSLKPIVVFRL